MDGDRSINNKNGLTSALTRTGIPLRRYRSAAPYLPVMLGVSRVSLIQREEICLYQFGLLTLS